MHFIRHGESQFNLLYAQHGRDPGIHDAPLTPRGLTQAQAAGKKLAGKGITRIISSPYTRALQTASAIAEVIGADLTVEPLAGERRLYSCDIGTPAAALRQSWQHLDFSALQTDQWWPQKDETHADVARRVAAFGDKWGERLQGGGYALVSHWYFLHALTSHDLDNGEIVFKKLF
jgi:broad specificity phosphatase PhoE